MLHILLHTRVWNVRKLHVFPSITEERLNPHVTYMLGIIREDRATQSWTEIQLKNIITAEVIFQGAVYGNNMN
jgi:hypothetical protein